MNIASIDIGTNTVLMLIANISKDDKIIKPLLNEYKMPRVGKGLIPGGKISQNRVEALFEVLKYYSDLINDYNCEKVIAKATSAFRLASNSDEIIDKIKNYFDIEVEIISGIEEARLSFIGSISTVNFPEENFSAVHSYSFIVIDIGGGSTEVISGQNGAINYSKSFEAGVVNLTEKLLKHNPPLAEELAELNININNIFSELKGMFPKEMVAIAVAGTPTSLSCIKQGLLKYDEEKVEGSILEKNELGTFVSELSKMEHEEIIERYQEIVSGREDIILTGTVILFELAKILEIEKILVSARGIRYGAIIDYLEKDQ